VSEPKLRVERNSALLFLGGVGALVGTYIASFIVMEMLTARLV
jgi:hypothetical protein